LKEVSKIVRILYIFLGTLSLIIGFIAIVIPGIPTTPFLLLTAALYVRSSPKLYDKVIKNKFLGPYILRYKENKGMTKQQKFSAMGLMWFMISISALFLIQVFWVKIIVIGAGIIGTIVMGFFVPTSEN
jgi:uncharacterized membrane protein YbaN (DUF454 family)